MQNNFVKDLTRACRFILIAAIAVTGIQATGKNEELFIVRDPSTPDHSLTRFRGETAKMRRVSLKWHSTLPDNMSYTIEKSRDGENFAEVDSKKIRLSNGEFSWMDEFPKVMNCYRLKMKDGDGMTKYSRTLVISMPKSGNTSMVSATPDMTRNDIDVDIELKEEAMLTMLISGKSGDILLRQVAKAGAGLSQYCIKGSNELKPGEYFLKVIANGTDVLQVKLIKE